MTAQSDEIPEPRQDADGLSPSLISTQISGALDLLETGAAMAAAETLRALVTDIETNNAHGEIIVDIDDFEDLTVELPGSAPDGPHDPVDAALLAAVEGRDAISALRIIGEDPDHTMISGQVQRLIALRDALNCLYPLQKD